MSKTNRHVIQIGEYEISIKNESNSKAIFDSIHQLNKGPINALIEHYCNLYSSPQVTHRIEKLELDLGNISSLTFEKDFIIQFEKELSNALRIAIQPEKEEGKQPNFVDEELELFVFYLHHGALPWWVNAKEPKLLDNVLQNLLQNKTQQLRQVLIELLSLSIVRKRIASLNSSPGFHAIISLLQQDTLFASDEFPLAFSRITGISKQKVIYQWREIYLTWLMTNYGVSDVYFIAYLANELKLKPEDLIKKVELGFSLEEMETPKKLKEILNKAHSIEVELNKNQNDTQNLNATNAIRKKEGTAVTDDDTEDKRNRISKNEDNKESLNDLFEEVKNSILDWKNMQHEMMDEDISNNLSSDNIEVMNEELFKNKEEGQAINTDGESTQQHTENQLKNTDSREAENNLNTKSKKSKATERIENDEKETNKDFRTKSNRKDEEKLNVDSTSKEFEDKRTPDDTKARIQSNQSTNSKLSPRKIRKPVDLRFSNSDELFIENAGIVLLGPYLPNFFRSIGLLNKNDWVNSEAQHKAISVLFFLASGVLEIEEYQTPLLKVLCGLLPDEPLAYVELLDEDTQFECINLLESVIAHATFLGDLSVDGFRGSYLLRTGILGQRDGNWLLQVERASYDMLLDKIPWTFHMLKLPWIKNFIITEW